ncbi:MAG: 50S ribosomal protein L4 [Nitrosomonas sp.]|nr:50S ribosomal protein L4 [Nitrosomonas sp.]MDP1951366.1 50S ribosomal protein L4 [Nitrosomonas sp.]
MELNLISENNQKTGNITVSDSLFDRFYNEALVHQLVTAYLANARFTNRAQKDRSEVSKSTRKPWKQKGTGRARVGAASSPLWRGGGQIFPNRPDENYTHKVNRKMYRAGISTILSQLIRDDRLLIIDTLLVNDPKTSALLTRLKKLGLENVMIVTGGTDRNLYLSARNIPNVKVVEANFADPYNLLRYEKTLVTVDGIKKFEELMA